MMNAGMSMDEIAAEIEFHPKLENEYYLRQRYSQDITRLIFKSIQINAC